MVYETTHLVRWKVPQSDKNITPEFLEKRFIKLIDISKNKLWVAKSEDVVDYELMRRNIYFDNIKMEKNCLTFLC